MKRSSVPQLSRRGLHVLAASIWLFAGTKVLAVAASVPRDLGWVALLWFAVALVFFSGFIFPRVVRRNIGAVESSQATRLPFYRCFLPSSWIIMPVMMTLGIGLRMSGWVGHEFILGFYTGLGLSLVLAVRFYLRPIFSDRTR